MESLIDDEGAKRKVRGLIANIGNYGTRGDRGHLPSLAREGLLFYPNGIQRLPPVSVGAGAPRFGSHLSLPMIASSLVEWMVDEVERLTQISMKLSLKTTFAPHPSPSSRPLVPIHDCRCSRAGEKTACSKPTTRGSRPTVFVS
ncbi:hypothetical protein QLX08_009755 [Tetragonisca angustula]|uniref:Uncharacterized protein n=1 Tax=Tetragonisca angustula TaxID=166442 RepID=A0AAW0ZEW4_9HYME